MTHGPTETDSIENILPGLIELRDQALGENFNPAAAVLLSHTIAWMNWIKKNRDAFTSSDNMLNALKRIAAHESRYQESYSYIEAKRAIEKVEGKC